MNVELKYFSGTGNSYKIIDTCKEAFIKKGNKATLSSITDKYNINEDADLVGFCFPVYAFGIPRICRKYLSKMPIFENPVKAFVLITAGNSQEAGFSIKESTNLLKKNGFDVTYTKVIQMPANWTVAMNPPSKEEATRDNPQGYFETPTPWGVSIFKHSSKYISSLLQAYDVDILKTQKFLIRGGPDNDSEDMLFSAFVSCNKSAVGV